jgi:alkylation response protein AidB-like acyl-CoA dehydrogenase
VDFVDAPDEAAFRAQSVMGGTSQIQRNLVATRILELPTS